MWANMKTRCNNKNYGDYHRYGGRGIGYDVKWETFGGFFDDMYENYLENVKKFGKKNTTLDRIDNDKNYCKLNCRFSNFKQQAINRNNTRLIKYKGVKKTITDWAVEIGIKRSTLSQRFYVYKWPINKCLNKNI